MKRIFLLIFYFVIGQSYAQHEPEYTMFWTHYSTCNPAATGLFGKYYAELRGRINIWDVHGIENPYSQSGLFDFRWDKISSGIGINYFYGQLGFEKDYGLKVNYAYHIDLKKDRVISAGLSLGRFCKSIDFSKFNPIDPHDPLLNMGIQRKYSDNINVGIFLRTPRFLLGISAVGADKENANFSSLNYMYFCVIGAYNQDIGKKFLVKPGIIVKSYDEYTQYEINCLVYYKKRVWAGIAYRPDDAIGLMAGIDIKGKFRIGYAHDFVVNKLSYFHQAPQEVSLGLMID